MGSKITKEQCKDTGMAMVLVLLLLALWRDEHALAFVKAATLVLVLDMIHPPLFRPLAVLWFGLSHLLGTVMSKVLLSVVFFVVVMPVGLIRRAMGKDSLRLREFKKGEESVMVPRNHAFIAADLEKPY